MGSAGIWPCCLALVASIAGCRPAHYPPSKVPGDTAIGVSAVTIAPQPGTHLEVAYKPLYAMLGLRAKTLLYPQRGFNEYRLVEDRRRIEAFLQGKGRFDAVVDAPIVELAPDRQTAAVRWSVREGPNYPLASVTLIGAPPDLADELRAVVTFHPGDAIDLDPFRLQRLELALHLQDRGYGHARAYSRAFVDRAARTVAWFFYLDPGPRTTVGSLGVEGNAQVPIEAVVARSGLVIGEGFSTAAARRAELALLDTGAFVSVNIVSDADIARLPEYPDSGGMLAPDQIAADGTLVPRTLPTALGVKIVVVEAPARQLHAELGIEADPTRIDAFTGVRVMLRHLFAPQHHLALEGQVGYGWIVGDGELARGVYGSALVQYSHPLEKLTTVEARLTARWRDVLYPAALLRELVAGPGLHATLARGVSLDADAFARHARTLDQPALDPATTGGLALPTTDRSRGLEVRAGIVADRRDDRIEPSRGWLLGGTAAASPGGPVGDHRWVQLAADARAFVPLGAVHGAWSLALRGSGGVVLAGATGVPLGARLFGGGAYGLRGFGRDRLSPAACTAAGACDVLVGGRSLVEASVELRWLPYRKQVGAVTFVDAGNAGAGTNAFADGVALAAGAGVRVRLWYLPVAIDVAYRVLDDSTPGLAAARLLAFLRVGEAF
ncbi:MAG: BamA/TamA family outer membrane protein [Proteobacteria bacterium]|nr:BamA/TamA family outer membrane protein [Pseudomonadota bacterium]